MSRPTVLQDDYSEGMVRDRDRSDLPRGAVWNMVDWLPNRDAPLSRRGPWVRLHSSALTGATSVASVSYAPFSTNGQQVVAIDQGGDLHKMGLDGASVVEKGAAIAPISRPFFFKDLLIIPGSTPTKYDGSAAPASLGGTPPAGRFGTAWKSRAILGGPTADPQLTYFSDPLAPETWNTTSGWIRHTQPVNGYAPLRNALLVFSQSGVERLRGDVPPPGGDMIRESIFEEGCIDARSIVVLQDRAIWANQNGVWISDGAGLENLIDAGGMQNYWTDLMSGYQSSWIISAGTFRNHLVISVGTSSAFEDCLVCDLERKIWFRFSNVFGSMFAEVYGASPKLFMGFRGDGSVAEVGTSFTPIDLVNIDLVASSVYQYNPVLETPFYRPSPGKSRWKGMRLGYHMTERISGDFGAADPKIKLSYVLNPYETSYTEINDPSTGSGLRLLETTEQTRAKVPLRLASDGVGLKVETVTPGTHGVVYLYDIEAEVQAREGGR